MTNGVERILGAGEVVAIGPLKIEAIPMPGHSHDHHCYLVRRADKRYLIGGGAVFFGGRIILQNTYDCSVPDSACSLQRLVDYPFDALLPGHLSFSLNNGRRHIEAACEVIKRPQDHMVRLRLLILEYVLRALNPSQG